MQRCVTCCIAANEARSTAKQELYSVKMVARSRQMQRRFTQLHVMPFILKVYRRIEAKVIHYVIHAIN
jgi:hypothetical protein